MIRLYSFYSVGGYKDMYLGQLSADSASTYYLPLLSIMKKRNKAEEVQKIAELEKLEKIQIIRRDEKFDFPDSCKSLFSHGGYIIMYKTLDDGSVCLAIRNLSSSMKDEEGRSTSFSLLFVADAPTDIDLLDNTATYCLRHYQDLSDILSPTIVYDAKVNGLRADLSKIYAWMTSCLKSKQYIHTPNTVDYLMVTSLSFLSIALQEQNLNEHSVNAVVLPNGHVCQGKLELAETVDKLIIETGSTAIIDEKPKEPIESDDTEEQDIEADEITVPNEVQKDSDGDKSSQVTESTENAALLPMDVQAQDEGESTGQAQNTNEYVTLFGKNIPAKLLPWLLAACTIIGFLIGLIF